MSRYARKRNDSIKPGMGIDGTKGESFTRQHNSTSWNPPDPSDKIMPSGGRYTDNRSGLRNLPSEEVRAGNNQAGVGRDISGDVEKNSREQVGSGPIKYGVD